MATESPYDGTCPRCGYSSRPNQLCERFQDREGCDTKILLPAREELLAAELPVEMYCVSIAPDGTETPCVYRFATEEARDNFGKAEAEILRKVRR